MFGIPILTLISYAVTYGPKAIALVQALAPVIEAAAPQIEALVKAGVPEAEATTKVFGLLAAPHKMTPEEQELWFARAQGAS
jgi:hypothetical protein